MQDETWDGGYYAVIPDPVLSDVFLRVRSMLLYAVITRRAARNGFCYAKNATLMNDMTRIDPRSGAVSAISERTLQSLLSELKDRGHISMDIGPYPPDRNGEVHIGRRIFIGVILAKLEPVQRGEENCTPESFCTHGGEENYTPIISSNNKSKNITPISPQEIARKYAENNSELRDALLGFMEMRVKKNKPLQTARAMNTLLNKLDKLAGQSDALRIALLDEATLHRWDSVYPLKSDELPPDTALRPSGKDCELDAL